MLSHHEEELASVVLAFCEVLRNFQVLGFFLGMLNGYLQKFLMLLRK